MGRAAALLVAAVAALALYDSLHERLWNASSDWTDVAFLAFVLVPVTFAVTWAALPLRTARGLLPVAVSLGVLTYAFYAAGWHTPENLTKLLAVTFAGFWFLGYFEAESWVVLVALIIPWVDAYSVFSSHGPTHNIVAHHEHVFTALSYALPRPGKEFGANLGIPDLLFFALFLAASARFGLRTGWTWLAMTAALGATFAIAVWQNLNGLPALPGLSIGLLLPNADLLWKRLRADRGAAGEPRQ